MNCDYHLPIMVNEVIAGLNVHEGLYLDGTAGGGSHSRAILAAHPSARLIATDKDEDAIARTRLRLSPFAGRFELYHIDFKNFADVLGDRKIDGFLLDLGISSHQIDDTERGFAYRDAEAPLDMRMDRRNSFSAFDVVNGYSEEKLKETIRNYGEEEFAPAIAKNIVRRRAQAPICTCGELKTLVEESLPPRKRSAACARQTFQAIRIEVNGELEGLEASIRAMISSLKKGGRACILSFHSLEDRIVKNVLKDLSTACTCPKSFPVCVCGRKQQVEILTKKPLVAQEEEQANNPRSKSAKLRIAEKITE